ncbi:MAG: 16S rRNA (cytidine(1402)-2'-O)-methyltransferase [Acidimicrobiia bacterium]
MPGTLVLCATPIGNLSDASPRLREALAGADVVYCEDTRRSRKLLSALGVQVPLRSYFVANEDTRSDELGRHLERGETVALITDAGTPAVADPGLTAVRAAIEADATVTVVPGPSAVTAAVAVSGLPSERFVFEGFLPRKQEARRSRIEELADEPRTLVLFVAAARAGAELAALAESLGGDRPAVVARELTKLHEEVWRGTLAGAAHHYTAEPPRGELTVVVGGAPVRSGNMGDAVAEVDRLTGDGLLFSEAVKAAADIHSVRRRQLYETARRLRDGKGSS